MTGARRINVLVFPCGSENAGDVYQALRYCLHVRVTGASSVDDHGRFRFANYVGGLPGIGQPGFDAAFTALLRAEGIDMVFPTHDSVAAYLAPRAAAMGVHLVNGDATTTEILRSKRETYRMFAARDWCPAVYADPDGIPAWPVIVKPDRGQGGQGVTLVTNRLAAQVASAAIQDPVLLEYLPGAELTVDCFTDRHRRLVWIGPRTRERVRAGIAMRAVRVELDDRLREIAETVNAGLVLRGPWYFQVRQDVAGQWKLLEICCRVGGSMVFQRARGINLPLLAVHDFMGRDVTPLANPFVQLIDRNLATRAQLDYDFDHVYVDLDDTLIVDRHAVPAMVAFLYQCLAAGKRLHLVTRHAHDPIATLAQARIGADLFDSIHHLRQGESKADVIAGRALFIDNHFPERLDVFTRRNIPVLDVDAVELLLA